MKKSFIKLLVLTMVCSLTAISHANENVDTGAPEWAKDLIIYEIATKGFTSPAGPESGTFNSLKDKLPYLEELGINAIWLTGHSYSDSSHFYGIWTQYACIEPGKLDPSLGTLEEFKAMVNEAHVRGIRIFLDTIEHGVMDYSILIKEHPDWFKGGSWGMIDYDWEGGHSDLDEWWIEMWTNVALDWGVDGFRCDMGLHRPDLWEEIKRRCAKAGKPIFLLGESGRESISHASQRDIMLYDIRNGRLDQHAALTNLAAMEDLKAGDFTGKTATFNCEIKYGDQTLAFDNTPDTPQNIHFLGLGEDVVGRWEYEKEGDPDWSWILQGVDPEKPYDHIRLYSPERSWHWQTEGSGWKLVIEKVDSGLKVSGGDPLPGERFRVVAPSCHDCGWDGFPLDENPYTVRGSRHIFGYATLFVPAIPLFMSGEEFDAQYVPLPRHTPGLFGAGEPGTGRWLYASWLQWDQLDQPSSQGMLRDVKRMIEIRSQHADLIHGLDMSDKNLVIKSVDVTRGTELPVPYILTNGKRALLIVGNPDSELHKIVLNINAETLGLKTRRNRVRMTSLWPEEQASKTMKLKKLSALVIEIPADGEPGGGLQVIRFDPYE